MLGRLAIVAEWTNYLELDRLLAWNQKIRSPLARCTRIARGKPLLQKKQCCPNAIGFAPRANSRLEILVGFAARIQSSKCIGKVPDKIFKIFDSRRHLLKGSFTASATPSVAWSARGSPGSRSVSYRPSEAGSST